MWVGIEVTAAGSMVLAYGWQVFARTRGLSGRCTLHFKYDGLATLFVRVFREDNRCAGCCPEDGNGNNELGLDAGPVPATRVSLALTTSTLPPAAAALLRARAPAAATTTNLRTIELASRKAADCLAAAPR